MDPRDSRVTIDLQERAYRLRLWLVFGLAIVVGSGLAVGLILLPGAVHSTTLRVWIGLAMFGVLIAFGAGALLYLMEHDPTLLMQRRRPHSNPPRSSGESD